ncbi:MAG: OB-fold nucleic acid binding domain-containing protein, partial [Acidimicrobiia bacterium]
MGGPLRTARAEDVTEARVGEQVRLAGWVSRARDHGGITFVDLRDASGVIQVVIDPVHHPAVRDLHMEDCIAVAGEVRVRPEGTENPELPTGKVEVAGAELTVLSPAETLPFMVDDRVEVDERARLQYRYLD